MSEPRIDWAAIHAGLSAPIDPSEIDFRPQGEAYERNGKHSGRVLAYIDARTVMNRLDAVVGPENWYGFPDVLISDTAVRVVRYALTIHGVTKYAIGDAGATEPSKAADSDGLKRAGVPWGIARELYALESEWVEAVPMKNKRGEDSWRIADGEADRLRKKLATMRARQQGQTTQAAEQPQERRAPREAAPNAPTPIRAASVPAGAVPESVMRPPSWAFTQAAQTAGLSEAEQKALIKATYPNRGFSTLTAQEWHALEQKCRAMYSDVPAPEEALF